MSSRMMRGQGAFNSGMMILGQLPGVWKAIALYEGKGRTQFRGFALPVVLRFALIFAVASIFGRPTAACPDLPAGTHLRVRLQTALSSYSTKPGAPLRAFLTKPVGCELSAQIPPGTELEGVVVSVTKVGIGFRHEAASLELEFDRLVLPSTEPLEIRARVFEVENAREAVKQGIIHGVRLSSVPQGLISSRLIHFPTMNPYSDLALLIFKTTFPVFPDPEINFPAGTDLVLELAAPLSLPEGVFPSVASRLISLEDTAALDQLVGALPNRTTSLDGKSPADIVNLLFVGSHEQLVAAFSAAGWTEGDPISLKSTFRNFYAVLAATANPRAPMSTLLLEGVRPCMKWQKALNSYAKRHHVRVWRWPDTWQGQSLWLAAATHDVGVSLSPTRMSFRHQIDPDIDEERSIISQHLSLTGFVDSVHLANRPDVPRISRNATGSTIYTDGALAVMWLKDYAQPVFPAISADLPLDPGPRHWFARLLRREVLMLRSDYVRANIFYGAYDLSRFLWGSHIGTHNPVPSGGSGSN